MKIILGILVALSLYGETIFTVDASESYAEMKFLKFNDDSCYYKNFYISQGSCYKLTGNIIIKEKKQLGLEFLNQNNLKHIRKINILKSINLYGYRGDDTDLIEIVNQLNYNHKNILEARVEWIKPRKLF